MSKSLCGRGIIRTAYACDRSNRTGSIEILRGEKVSFPKKMFENNISSWSSLRSAARLRTWSVLLVTSNSVGNLNRPCSVLVSVACINCYHSDVSLAECFLILAWLFLITHMKGYNWPVAIKIVKYVFETCLESPHPFGVWVEDTKTLSLWITFNYFSMGIVNKFFF